MEGYQEALERVLRGTATADCQRRRWYEAVARRGLVLPRFQLLHCVYLLPSLVVLTWLEDFGRDRAGAMHLVSAAFEDVFCTGTWPWSC
jgi:hypothetical protein